MTKDPEMKEILEELVELEEPKMTGKDELTQEMRNNEEEKDDEDYERMDNQDARPVTITSIKVLTDAQSNTTLPPTTRSVGRVNMDGLGVTTVTAVTPVTAINNQQPTGKANPEFTKLTGAIVGRNGNNTTVFGLTSNG